MVNGIQEFNERLDEVFRGRLRARWSHKTQSVHIEQKVGRMVQLNVPVGTMDDLKIRLRDGCHYVLEVQPGDRMPCPACRKTLQVPTFEFRELQCMCGKKMAAAYFPLGESLVDHLKRIDPMSGASKQLRFEVNEQNRRATMGQARELGNIVEGAGKDQFNQMAQIQSVGYTKNTGRMWDR